MLDHKYLDVYPFEDIPLNQDCYLMDECYLPEYQASWSKFFDGKGWEPIGYISYAVARKINKQTIDLSWYPNLNDRFHEVSISLPRSEFVTCVGCWQCDEKPHIFVKSRWLDQLFLKTNSVFCMVDAIGVKDAIRSGSLKRLDLIQLREKIDRLAENHSEMFFISFADSIIMKSNWTVGYFKSSVTYTYNPEIFFQVIKELQSIYRDVLGMNVYAILVQGVNEYYEDELYHISNGENHVSLNSLGIPFANLMAIDKAVHTAIKVKNHEPYDLYIDKHFYNSLQFKHEFEKRLLPKYGYSAPMLEGIESQYYTAQLQEILDNLRKK